MHFEWFKQETGFPGAGVFSVCSAHPLVLRTALRSAREAGTPVLVESTVNQVNPDGGYTGMRPADFQRFLEELAASEQFPAEKSFWVATIWGPIPGTSSLQITPWKRPGCWPNSPCRRATGNCTWMPAWPAVTTRPPCRRR